MHAYVTSYQYCTLTLFMEAPSLIVECAARNIAYRASPPAKENFPSSKTALVLRVVDLSFRSLGYGIKPKCAIIYFNLLDWLNFFKFVGFPPMNVFER